ncbi:hypothetical protein PUN28_015502 [Cardiocondyla obscurior]|uniref:Uncharacterized protein n=1 Tax=Cardiocondyla obscurior TaxID=286306 RepID=A0AAW2EVP0_9HYME
MLISHTLRQRRFTNRFGTVKSKSETPRIPRRGNVSIKLTDLSGAFLSTSSTMICFGGGCLELDERIKKCKQTCRCPARRRARRFREFCARRTARYFAVFSLPPGAEICNGHLSLLAEPRSFRELGARRTARYSRSTLSSVSLFSTR